MSDVTLILEAANRGEEGRLDELLTLLYDELRKLAAARMTREAGGHTLQPTALVHEAWLRMVGDGDRSWKNRAYFFAAAAESMRRILIEHARRKACLKAGGGQERLNVDDLELSSIAPDSRVLLIDEALERLEQEQPERARVVVLKYFGGLTNAEVADIMDISRRTVIRHWLCAKAWLFRKIREQL